MPNNRQSTEWSASTLRSFDAGSGSRLDVDAALWTRPSVQLGVALVGIHHLPHVLLRLIEVDGREKEVVAGRGREARPECNLFRTGVVGRCDLVAVGAELL